MKLSELLATKSALLQRYIKRDVPRIIGVEAKKHFREGFQKEGFTGATFEPWQEVKRRAESKMKRNKNGKVSKRQHRDQLRKILVDKGHMRDSIDYSITGMDIEVGTDDEIGKVQAHNEGTTTAGRNNKVTIPKRQFIGPSAVLDKKLETRLSKDVTNILKT